MKIFILGLDGATFNCLDPMMGEGILPNIKEMCSNWSYGPLRTIFPPVTAPAWLALATGLNPGKTGVFDYINKTRPDSDEMVPISSAYYEKRAVWDLLNNNGHKVGIFNYPTLSPPPVVNGFAVSGMGGYAKENLCYPPVLEDEINKITDGYETRLNLRNVKYKKNINLFFNDIERIFSKQSIALRHLIQEKEWDFFFAVFSFTDWMQHVLWKFIDEHYPRHDKSASSTVMKRFKLIWGKIDAFIGEVIDILPAGTSFMIVSDHGAGAVDSVFYPNSWLKEKGWLVKKNMGLKGVLSEHVKLFASGSDNKYANKLLLFLKNRILKITGSIDLIDMDNSLAYSPEHNTMFGCINLTRKGRGESNFKDRLIEEIKRLPYVVEGIEKIDVYLPEEIYSGSHVNLSPDIFFIINDYRTTVEVDFVKKSFISEPSIDMRTGGHQPDGIFIARGDMFRHVALRDISVLDIAPTVLAMYGIEIPFEIDGKVITDCIHPEILGSMDIRKSKVCVLEEHEAKDKGDLEEMKNTLKSLGYM